MVKRTNQEILEEIYEEAKKEAPYDPYLLLKMRWEEMEYSRRLKREHQGNKRLKNPFHIFRRQHELQ